MLRPSRLPTSTLVQLIVLPSDQEVAFHVRICLVKVGLLAIPEILLKSHMKLQTTKML